MMVKNSLSEFLNSKVLRWYCAFYIVCFTSLLFGFVELGFEEVIASTPFTHVDLEYIPAILLQKINDRFLIREPDKLYELQFSSLAIPPSIYNFKCYPHLSRMRESYGFVLYFVITDSLFYLIPIIITTFSFIRFVKGENNVDPFGFRTAAPGRDKVL